MRGACVRALPQVLPIPAVVPKADRGAGWNSTELRPWVALVYPRVMSSIFGWVEVDVGNFDIPSQGHLTVMVLAERAVPPLTRSHMHANRYHALNTRKSGGGPQGLSSRRVASYCAVPYRRSPFNGAICMRRLVGVSWQCDVHLKMDVHTGLGYSPQRFGFPLPLHVSALSSPKKQRSHWASCTAQLIAAGVTDRVSFSLHP